MTKNEMGIIVGKIQKQFALGLGESSGHTNLDNSSALLRPNHGGDPPLVRQSS